MADLLTRPLGGGRRICVGAGFAQLEATLALATLARSHRLKLVPGASVVPQAEEDAAEHQRAGPAEEQHPVLELPRHAEVAADQRLIAAWWGRRGSWWRPGRA